jgi:hypothetical protein
MVSTFMEKEDYKRHYDSGKLTSGKEIDEDNESEPGATDDPDDDSDEDGW